MFENLTDRLQDIFGKMGRKGKLSEEDVEQVMREVKLAMLEADVNFKVVKDFINRLKARAVGAEVMQSLSPAQQVVKIVNEELVAMLGEPGKLDYGSRSPAVIMLVGLQGSGKTTTAAKLALFLRRQGLHPLLVAADVYRPAAIDQLITLGKQLNIPVYSEPPGSNPVGICENAVRYAKQNGNSVLILDTAGRLHIDDAMMDEVATIRMRVDPTEVILIADAMTGQDAVRVAEEFNARVPLSGLILTKVDGDARGGAALSIRSVTGIPIKFLSVGEKPDQLEQFYPDRLASRILGMGDMLSLIEKAEASFDQSQGEEMERRLRAGHFDLEDFLQQLQQIKKMGPLSQIMEMIPGMRNLTKNANIPQVDDGQLKRVEAIINSMTRAERRDPTILDASRRRRIAAGSGTSVQELNALLSQFRQMQKMMKQISGGRMPKLLGGIGGRR
ncbi:MAG TPA: signal recognition particle protein [Chloroflexota bacterium]|nr:signal recognition particle protein [Chloroflexota bacterium]